MRAVSANPAAGADVSESLKPPDLADALADAVWRAEEVDMRAFEERPREALQDELLPAVRSVTSEGLNALERVLRAYEDLVEGEVEDDGSDNFYVEIDRVLHDDGPGSHVADLAFMAHLELTDRVEVLARADPSWDRWRLLGECDSCLRRLRKAASAVERAIALDAGLAPRLEYLTETSLGRVIRAYYARFRREVAGDGPPGDERVHERLLSAAASIAKLIGRDFYGDLRVSDRAGLRGLQERLRRWLQGEDGFDPLAGRRIWQDLNSFASLLAQVNRRTELVEHDREIVASTLRELEGDESPGELPQQLLVYLERLRGLSDRLDALLTEPVTRERGPWLRELRRLERELGAGAAAADATPSSDQPSTPGSRLDR